MLKLPCQSIFDIMSMQPGEDTALSNYCQACILLESIAKNWCPQEIVMQESVSREQLIMLSLVIMDCMSLTITSICLSQFCLHSSPHQVGTCTDFT